ncbi:uncharacterized protein M421DRAFT_60280 [Didymella exigua CBS 183.55]|uniref:Uncharacterized protein n=1 Tax=Didymella exigua CBS 183.55 TaxID=1150837 RepID=A0A6A5RPL7_9PLEO|nr:uncharacterized protein M421DRAFT_60280 [Didymella exigua CBS 183.55]KAF1929599.1 hypothetical protein M421DRAFT_60280 [Didymella exigua CBS 183.55]
MSTNSADVPKRRPVPKQPAVKRKTGVSRTLHLAFLAVTAFATLSFRWPYRWILSGAPELIYALLLGEAKGNRVLPFVPLWTIFATVNFVYAVCSTSWLLFWVFWAACWPTFIIVCLFMFDAPAGLARRLSRKTFLRDLHFIDDQVAFFDLPALEIDTEVKGLFVIRGVTLSLSTLTLVAHGIEAGIKLSDEIELGIQVDKVTVPLFRQILVDDVYANIKGGEWEVTFGDVPYGKPDPADEDSDDSFIAADTAILKAAAAARPAEMLRSMTADAPPTDSEDTKSAFSSVKQLSPDEEKAKEKYRQYIKHMHDTSSIQIAKKQLIEKSHKDENNLDPDKIDDLRAAICAQIHSGPSIPHPPSRSIRVSTLRKTSYPNVKRWLHRFPFLYRLMLFPICYFHTVKFKSVSAAGSGKWFVALMRKYLFKHYSSQDGEIRRLEARISDFFSEANFCVELTKVTSGASFPLNTNYDIKCNFEMSDVMAYRSLPDAVDLKRVVELGGLDASLNVPIFLFPHHEHIFPSLPTDLEIMDLETQMSEAGNTAKAMQAQKTVKQLKKDEANMHVSAHAHLPMIVSQEMLNFIAAIVKATKVIESDRGFEEAKVLRELKRVGDNGSDTESVSSMNSVASDVTVSEDKSFKAFLRKVDSGFKDASQKTAAGMRKAGVSTVSAMANDRWIASVVGKMTRKLEKAQGEVGYSGAVPISLAEYRVRHEDDAKILP